MRNATGKCSDGFHFLDLLKLAYHAFPICYIADDTLIAKNITVVRPPER